MVIERPSGNREIESSDEEAAPRSRTVDARSKLAATIEDVVIPRLVLAQCSVRAFPTKEQTCELAECACEGLTSAFAFIRSLTDQGASLQTLLLDLVPPAARLLGQQWDSDLRTFADVAIGLETLQQVVHLVTPALAPRGAKRGLVVLLPLCADQHTLGLNILGTLLRSAGWRVDLLDHIPEPDLLFLVGSEPVEMVGISVWKIEAFEPLRRLVARLKEGTMNPDLAIMVGGAPELAEIAPKIGASFYASPRDALHSLYGEDAGA